MELFVARGQEGLDEVRRSRAVLNELAGRFRGEVVQLETADLPERMHEELMTVAVLQHISLPQTRRGKGAKTVLVVRRDGKVASFFPQVSGKSDRQRRVSILEFLDGLREGRIVSLHSLDLGD